MSRLVARAESFERVYDAFNSINFAAFDYDTVKQSLLDYVKLYFPETFNDFIESSEFIAIVETFAYIAELLAYRIDINAHENFISTAQRKDSILRLAKLVSYTASRPLPARGLVKITSVTTSESVIDANGNDLAGRKVSWNDVSNSSWKEQFILVMNRVLEQRFGTVGPTDRFQIQDVLFELYSWNLTPLSSGVFSYTASASGQSAPMELVPIEHDTKQGIVERRPQNNSNFTFLYGQDGLGDASDTTGFFCYTKQGSLQKITTSFDGVTPNQTYDVSTSNVNDIDVWINNVDPATGTILDAPSTLPYRREATSGKSGEWVQVDLAHAQNVIFNTNPKRNKYEVETRDGNKIRLIFGDGEFADVPSGTFDIWVRASLDKDVVVSQTSVSNTSSSFTYVDAFARTQTFSFTFSLINTLQNASASEDIEHVRTTAPAVYYSQDRMVNGEDYNVFMLQDPSILKLRALNRTFAGDSKYIAWHDATGTYENVKIFGNDGVVYYEDKSESTVTPVVGLNELISTYIEPLLSSTDIFVQLTSAGVDVNSFRRVFNNNEKTRISAALSPPPTPAVADFYYNTNTAEWYAIKRSDDPTTSLPNWGTLGYWATTTPIISVTQRPGTETKYTVARAARRLIFQSQTTAFWNTNSAERVIDYDTLDSNKDNIIVLQANVDETRSRILKTDWTFDVLGQEVNDSGPDLALPDIHRLSILPADVNLDGIPDNLPLTGLIHPTYTTTGVSSVVLTLPTYYIGTNATNVNGFGGDISGTGNIIQAGADTISNQVTVTGTATIRVKDYVYFTRESTFDPWVPASPTPESISAYVYDQLAGTELWKRREGRGGLNFAWLHRSPNYHLVDPSPSNIIDSFIITKGYYMSLKRWLEDPLVTKPTPPTSLDLRTSYGYMLDNGMISDTIILHPGKMKLMFGSKSPSSLQSTFKVVRSANGTLTDNQIKTKIVTVVRNFFDIATWEFGETFYATELFAAIHAALPSEISSVVIVPLLSQNQFGDLFQVIAREDEIFYPDVSVDNIEIVVGYTATNLRLNG